MTDGLSATIFISEIARSDIHWMEPRDLHIDRMSFQINDKTKPSISSHHRGGAHVLFADGSVRFLRDSTPPEIVRALLTIDGGEEIDWDQVE